MEADGDDHQAEMTTSTSTTTTTTPNIFQSDWAIFLETAFGCK